MTHSFNLIDQRWIPCITNKGEFVEVSLYELLSEAQHLREICCETPIMTASIFPLALAILHRVFGPEDIDVWDQLWKQGAFPIEPLQAYFNQWYDRFDLFHPEYPFYQMKDDRVKPKSLIHLVHSIGNTGTLFTHANDDDGITLSPAEAARHLLTAQYFRTAGLSGLDEKFTDSSLARGVIFWAIGSTLWETLMLNLVAYPADNILLHTSNDKPVWEKNDPSQPHDIPNGYLDYLTWFSNRVWFMAEDDYVREMTIAPGLSLNSEVKNPQKRYVKRIKKDEIIWSFLYFNTDKALWRDFHSLLALDQEDVKPPAVIEWLAKLRRYGVLTQQGNVKLMGIGMLADQAKPIFYRQEVMPLPLILLGSEQKISFVQEAIQQAEDTAEKLHFAIRLLAENTLMRGGDQQPDSGDRDKLIQQWDALSVYWEALENHFWRFITDLPANEDEAIAQWQATLQATAISTLDEVVRMAGESPWVWKGSVVAKRILRGGLKNVFKQ